jgi:sugar phosphate permease
MFAESLDVQKGRYQVLAFLCVCAVIAYIQRAALSVPAAEIARDLRFSDLAGDMGRIQSAWYLGYALMQLPSGWLADRIGSRRGLAFLSVVGRWPLCPACLRPIFSRYCCYGA